MSEKPANRVNRRKFMAGLLTGVGVTSVAMAAGRGKPVQAEAQGGKEPATKKGPVLYRRTPEIEAYYKTLYR